MRHLLSTAEATPRRRCRNRPGRVALPVSWFWITLLVVSLQSTSAMAQERRRSGPTDAETPIAILVEAGSSSVGFFRELLTELEIEVEIAGATTMPHHPLSVSGTDDAAFPAAGGSLGALFRAGQPAGWTGEGLPHRGGFLLRRGDRVLDLRDFTLRPSDHPFALELADADGRAVLEVRTPLPLLGGREPGDSGEPDVLHAINGDLKLTRTGARLLGLERRWILGTVESELRLAEPPTPFLPFAPELAEKGMPPPCGDWSGDVDVEMTLVQFVQQMGSEVEGRIVVAGDAHLRNIGTANVPWYSKFSGPFPPYGNDQHPFLVWAMYRLRADGIGDGIFEQMARSQLKHAFATANDDCDPGACGPINGHILGPGCIDWYTASTNVNNFALAPRDEVDPRTGIWAHCDEPSPETPSHFDPDGDCDLDHAGGGEDRFSHGMAVATAELGTGDRYFFESWYVVRDDVDIYNSMGHREIDPIFADGAWDFALVGSYQLGPALDRWVDPNAPAAGTANVKLATSDGAVQLAVTTTDLDGGLHRYVYALQNHEVAAGLTRFEMPLPPGATVSAVAMVDTDDNIGNDWVAEVTSQGVRWNAPAGNPLPWGGLFAFTVEVDAPPAAGPVGVSPGTAPPRLHAIASLTPDGAEVLGWIFADGFESGTTDAWGLP